MNTHTFRIIIEPDIGGTFHGYVPALPGCHTWGESLVDIKRQLHEAIEVYLEDVVADGEPVPTDDSLEAFETVQLPDTPGFSYA